MLYSTLHKRWPRLVASVVGELIAAAALNLFIVPLGLYTGGTLGLCQLIRTLLQSALGLETGSYDIAGILYFITNIPILLLAYKTLGRELVVKTIVCAVSYSFFYSIIPIPSTPIIDDYLTACMLGGILTGVGSGIVLTCGASGGGLDIVGLCLSWFSTKWRVLQKSSDTSAQSAARTAVRTSIPGSSAGAVTVNRVGSTPMASETP